MPDPERVHTVVRGWVAKAENDFQTAVHTLKLGEKCPTDTICFHAQQCVEKYLKAILVSQRIDFPRTHDLEILMALVPAHLRPHLSVDEQARLTDYATGARYPGWGEISLPEARGAVAIARRVRKEIRSHLSKERLRSQRK